MLNEIVINKVKTVSRLNSLMEPYATSKLHHLKHITKLYTQVAIYDFTIYNTHDIDNVHTIS